MLCCSVAVTGLRTISVTEARAESAQRWPPDDNSTPHPLALEVEEIYSGAPQTTSGPSRLGEGRIQSPECLIVVICVLLAEYLIVVIGVLLATIQFMCCYI